MQISAGLVIVKDNKIGLVKPKGLGKGQFSIPKGLINQDEPVFKAAIRETKEETGLTIPENIINKKPHILNYVSNGGLVTKQIYYFIVDVSDIEIKQDDFIDFNEVESFNFYDRNQAENLIYWKQLSVLNHLSSNRFGQKELRILESLNIVKRVKHPLYPIFLYNYTDICKKTQFWNDTTLWCRGLVLDINGNVIARPLKKFFEEYQLYEGFIPKDKEFKAIEKLDGALGILFFYHKKAIICTRQSFKSKQALKASQILYEKYPKEILNLNTASTYLFEIIYPNNRFITNYGEIENIFLLDIICNKSGVSLPLLNNFSKPKEVQAYSDDKKNEGVILKYSEGFNVKVKYGFYKKMYHEISLLKNEIARSKSYIGNDPIEVRLDFHKSYGIYKQKYLRLYIDTYRINKAFSDDEIHQLILKKNVFPG